MSVRIGLAGGRGYVGEELLGLMFKNPDFEVVYVGSRGLAGRPVVSEYRDLPTDLVFQDLSPSSIGACPADVWILAQANGQAEGLAEVISQTDAKIIDISSDFRFTDRWTYGLPEKNMADIRESRRVANPGCYATAAQLALLPLHAMLEGKPTVFGISGFSGAGRTPNDKNDPQRLANNILPYSLTGHTHEHEISRHLGREVAFMPHVASFFRGISVTVNTKLAQAVTVAQLVATFKTYYEVFPMVAVQQDIPEIQQVVGTNQALVGGFCVDARSGRDVTLVCVIDNLRKGAASQAIQNLNLMCGLASEKGLLS
ncbi:MAG: N-acetyl-gamma-glutamyl-phosphate reductase [Pirellulaceae bacterium]|nr:N-acetyl-gamma-glutamyl-phosphate reductase [Pirellulaceae bacterium]